MCYYYCWYLLGITLLPETKNFLADTFWWKGGKFKPSSRFEEVICWWNFHFRHQTDESKLYSHWRISASFERALGSPVLAGISVRFIETCLLPDSNEWENTKPHSVWNAKSRCWWNSTEKKALMSAFTSPSEKAFPQQVLYLLQGRNSCRPLAAKTNVSRLVGNITLGTLAFDFFNWQQSFLHWLTNNYKYLCYFIVMYLSSIHPNI